MEKRIARSINKELKGKRKNNPFIKILWKIDLTKKDFLFVEIASLVDKGNCVGVIYFGGWSIWPSSSPQSDLNTNANVTIIMKHTNGLRTG